MTQKMNFITLLLVFIAVSFSSLGANSMAFAEDSKKTVLDQRDVYMSLEALCGLEGLPYEFLIPKDEYKKAKIEKENLYLDMEEYCGEGITYRYIVIPKKLIKTKVDYEEDRQADAEALMSEDPTILEIKSKQ